jgi:Domain of unknown function (DUF4407)
MDSALSIIWKIAGANPRILKIISASKEKNYFTFLGLMILALALFAWYSVDYALMLVIDDKFGLIRVIPIVFGLAACFVYINLYRFVFVITPGEGEGADDYTNTAHYNVGLIVRFVCITLLGFIIAKCYELYLFEKSIEPILQLMNRGDQVELRHRTRLYLGFSVSEMEYIKTGGVLARVKLLHALMGWKIYFFSFPLMLMFCIPLILKTFTSVIQNGEYQRLKVLEQNLIIENARLLTLQYVKNMMKKATGKDIEPYNLQSSNYYE